MPRFVDSRCVLAVRDLAKSTQFYTEILGFREDPVEATNELAEIDASPLAEALPLNNSTEDATSD